MKTRIMYIELKTGFSDNGPARIGRVSFSKTGKTVYYRGKALQRLHGGGASGGNYFDVETGEEYWVSGVKRNRQDRHWAGSGPVEIDEDVREEYLALVAERDPEENPHNNTLQRRRASRSAAAERER